MEANKHNDHISATEGIMMVVYSFNLERKHNGEFLFKNSVWPTITVESRWDQVHG